MAATFDWFDQVRTKIGGSDLKGEFDSFMASIAQPCFVRRANLKYKCHCLKATGEPDPLCNDCSGLGFPYDDYPSLVRFVHKSDIDENPVEQGRFHQDVAYLMSDTLFKRIDQIVEVQTTRDGRVITPLVITRIHGVNKFQPMRGDDFSNLVFYRLEMGETQRGDVQI